jgi:hypothetical protein
MWMLMVLFVWSTLVRSLLQNELPLLADELQSGERLSPLFGPGVLPKETRFRQRGLQG